MTQRVTYSAIDGLPLSWERSIGSTASGHGKALCVRRRNPLTRCFSISRVCVREAWRGLPRASCCWPGKSRPAWGWGDGEPCCSFTEGGIGRVSNFRSRAQLKFIGLKGRRHAADRRATKAARPGHARS
jgi:hypothetical protein